MTLHPRLPAASAGLALIVSLTACGGSDADSGAAPEAPADPDVAACRALTLVDAALAAPRAAAGKGRVTVAEADLYGEAIDQATTLAGSAEVSQALVDATTDVVSAWSRTRSVLLHNLDPLLDTEPVAPVLAAEVRFFGAVTEVCTSD